jgi:hypothetical protein
MVTLLLVLQAIVSLMELLSFSFFRFLFVLKYPVEYALRGGEINKKPSSI